jgi:sulfite reductase (ferredoxin)
MGKARLKEKLIPHTILPSFQEDSSYYFDWEAEAEFSVEDLGPGECAGGALEMIDNHILEAEQELYQARILAEKHQHAFAVNKAYRAVVAGAKGILVTEGVDPNTDADTLAEFERLIMSKGIMPPEYHDLTNLVGDLGPKDSSPEFTQKKIAFSRGFVEACRTATEQIGQDLKLAQVDTGEEKQPQSEVQGSQDSVAHPSQVPVYDLRGVMCPMNYVKTKLKLEMMDHGEQLEVWLDAGEPIKNVPVSLRNDGHKILAEEPLEPEQNHFKILVEKVEA